MKSAPPIKSAGRNPRLSRERILESALREFAAQGFAGARVDAIARRARINKRMLYHYFGHKRGLFREVLRRKLAQRAAWLASAPDDPVESLSYWFELAHRDRDWIRLLEWEALQWREKKVIDEAHRTENAARAVSRMRERQARGLLPRGWDAGQLLLAMMGMTTYHLAFPQIARLVTGLSVSDPEFRTRREKFLRQIAAALRSQARTRPRRQSQPQTHFAQ